MTRQRGKRPRTMGMFRSDFEAPDLDDFKRLRRQLSALLRASARKRFEVAAAAAPYDEIRSLKGKVSFSVDWRKLRSDR